MGLSLGGMTTSLTGFHLHLRDPRVCLAATLAGPGSMFSAQFYRHARIPLLVVAGDIDAIVDYDANALMTFQRAGSLADLVTLQGATHTGFADLASVFMESMENPDVLGCTALMGNLPEEVDFVELLGGPGTGIIEPDTTLPCSVQPLPRSMRPSRQQDLARLAVLSFFEAHFSSDRLTRVRADRFLRTWFEEENPEIRVD
jgi:hypothetical protein